MRYVSHLLVVIVAKQQSTRLLKAMRLWVQSPPDAGLFIFFCESFPTSHQHLSISNQVPKGGVSLLLLQSLLKNGCLGRNRLNKYRLNFDLNIQEASSVESKSWSQVNHRNKLIRFDQCSNISSHSKCDVISCFISKQAAWRQLHRCGRESFASCRLVNEGPP